MHRLHTPIHGTACTQSAMTVSPRDQLLCWVCWIGLAANYVENRNITCSATYERRNFKRGNGYRSDAFWFIRDVWRNVVRFVSNFIHSHIYYVWIIELFNNLITLSNRNIKNRKLHLKLPSIRSHSADVVLSENVVAAEWMKWEVNLNPTFHQSLHTM